MAEVFAEIGSVTELPQFLKTIVEDRITAPWYAKAALKLEIGVIDDRYIDVGDHMNADLGKLWLEDLLVAIAKKCKLVIRKYPDFVIDNLNKIKFANAIASIFVRNEKL